VLVLALTDLVTIQVEVDGDATLDVQEPKTWIKGPWLVLPDRAPERRELGTKVIWKQTLHVEPVQPGDASLLVEPLRYRIRAGEWQTAAWQPIAARVTSKLTQADLNSARDITSIEELPAPPPRESQSLWIVGGIAGAVAIGVIAALWLRRSGTARVRQSPEEWTLYELQRLQALQLPTQGKHERFGTLLAGLVRRYLEKRFGLPARRQTTAEFLATLERRAILAEQRDLLGAFLRRCDLLKFAPVASSVDECRSLAEQAGQFISQQQPSTATSGPAGAT